MASPPLLLEVVLNPYMPCTIPRDHVSTCTVAAMPCTSIHPLRAGRADAHFSTVGHAEQGAGGKQVGGGGCD